MDTTDSPLKDTAEIDVLVYDFDTPSSSERAMPAKMVTVNSSEKVTTETRGKMARRAMLPIEESMAVAQSPLWASEWGCRSIGKIDETKVKQRAIDGSVGGRERVDEKRERGKRAAENKQQGEAWAMRR
jgi:hypothetical protein